MNFGFNTPFAEQIEFFRAKLNLPTDRWDDIQRSAHDRAFIVAGAGKADLLDDLRGAVDKAIAGESQQAFHKRFMEIAQRQGWHGWTGEGTKAGEAWRTRVIYQTNLATSYAAGRYRQLTDPEYLKLRPWWRYVHNEGVAHPRPLHQIWGTMQLTLRHDDPFWKTHFPPNGWGCRCRVHAVAVPEPGAATTPPKGWAAINPKTGAPVGIDRGFDYAPGANTRTSLEDFVRQKLIRLPPGLQSGLKEDAARWLPGLRPHDAAALVGDVTMGGTLSPVPGLPTWKDTGRIDLRDVAPGLLLPAPELLPAAATRAAALDLLAAELGVSAVAPVTEVRTPVELALIRYEQLAHLVEKPADARERYARFVLATLADPYEVWKVLYTDGGVRNRYIGLFEGARDFMVVVRVNQDGSLLWNIMQSDAKSLNKTRIGDLLYGK